MTGGLTAQQRPAADERSENGSSTAPSDGVVVWSSQEMLDRVETLIEDGRFKEGAYLCSRVLKDEPENPRATFGLARCVEHLEGSSQALELYRKALELDPELGEARAAAARILRENEPARATGGPSETVADQPPQSESTVASPRREAAARQQETPPDTVVRETVDQGATDPPPPPTTDALDELGAGRDARQMVSDVDEGTAPIAALTTEGGSQAPTLPAARTHPALEPTGLHPGFAIGLVGLTAAVLAGGFYAWRKRSMCTIRGQLDQSPLPDLLQWLSMGKKHGELKISSGATRGSLVLRDGQPMRAEWAGKRGDRAVFEILSLSRGTYVFRELTRSDDHTSELDLTLQQILMQWACQTDEAGRDRDGDSTSPLDSVDDQSLNIDLPF